MRNQQGVTLVELLISIAIISTVLVAILNFYNLSLKQSNKFLQETKLKFLAEEEMEKVISLPYNDPSLEAYGSTAGLTQFYERAEFLVKTNVVHIDPRTGEIPDIYPVNKEQETFLKRITISAARKDRMGGQVDVVYLKSP